MEGYHGCPRGRFGGSSLLTIFSLRLDTLRVSSSMQAGKPIVAATVDHTGDGDLHQTDPSGRFELDTRAPAIVIWKAGYRSQLVRTQTGGDVQIILQTEARGVPDLLRRSGLPRTRYVWCRLSISPKERVPRHESGATLGGQSGRREVLLH